jgi:hypothetical protein
VTNTNVLSDLLVIFAISIAVVFVSALDGDAASFYERRGFTRCTGPWLYHRTGRHGAAPAHHDQGPDDGERRQGCGDGVLHALAGAAKDHGDPEGEGHRHHCGGEEVEARQEGERQNRP